MAISSTKNTKINPSIGFISILIYSLFIATIKEIDFLLFIPIVVQLLFLDIDFKILFKKIIRVNLFIFITFLILVLEDKYELALLVFIRANLILLFTLSFNFDGFSLYKAMNNLKISNKFSLIFFFTVKYIEILFSTAIRLKSVIKIRGFKAKFNMDSFKTYADMLGFLLYISVNKMEKVEDLIVLRTKDDKLFPAKKIVVNYKDILLLSSIIGVIFVYYFK